MRSIVIHTQNLYLLYLTEANDQAPAPAPVASALELDTRNRCAQPEHAARRCPQCRPSALLVAPPQPWHVRGCRGALLFRFLAPPSHHSWNSNIRSSDGASLHPWARILILMPITRCSPLNLHQDTSIFVLDSPLPATVHLAAGWATGCTRRLDETARRHASRGCGCRSTVGRTAPCPRAPLARSSPWRHFWAVGCTCPGRRARARMVLRGPPLAKACSDPR